jgi:PAS domain S-box-containing protein
MTNKRQASGSKGDMPSNSNATISSHVDFGRVFRSLQANFVILKPDKPFYTILDISDELLQITGKKRNEVINKSVFEAYPENPAAPTTTSTGASSLRTSLNNALESKFLDDTCRVRYDIKNANGEFEARYWSASSKPVLDSNGEVSFILHSTADITDQVKAEKRQQKLREAEKTYKLLMQAPVAVCIVIGPDNIVQIANDEMLSFLGKSEDIVGKPLLESIPETIDQGFAQILDQVRKTGLPFQGAEYQVSLNVNGGKEDRYYNFICEPYYDSPSDKTASGVFSVAHNVTEQVIARKKLKESEQKFSNVVQQASDMILIVKGEELIIEVANEALLHLWQLGPEVMNKPLKEIAPEMVEQGFIQIVRDVFRTGQPYHGYEVQAVLLRKNGLEQTRYFNFSYHPYKEADESITGVLIIASDITEQTLTRNKLNESESRFRSIVEQAPVAFMLTRGKDLVVETINAPMLKIIGRSNSEKIMGRTLLEVLPEIKDQPIYNIVNQVLETGRPFVGSELPVKLNSGNKLIERYYNLSYTPLIEDRKITGVLHVATDVTEQVMSRRKVEASEQELRSFIESAPFPIGIYTGKEMRIQFANQAILDAWGKGYNVIGKKFSDILPELDNQEIFQQLESVYTKGIAYHAKNQRVDLVIDGKLQPYYFNYNFTPLYNANGQVYGVMNTAADVTDLNMAHKKIEESEKNLRNVILQAPVAMSILRGPKYVIEIANDRMFELWGRKKRDLLHKELFLGLPEIKEQGYEELLARVYNTGETFSAYGSPVTLPRHGSVETCYINFVYEAFREGDGRISGIMVVASDVTEQVLASKKIEEAEERARLAVLSAELGTFEVNLITNEIVASPRMAEIFDVESESDRGRYISAIHPDDQHVRDEAYRKASKTGIVDYDGRTICKDGSVHWIRVRGKMYNNKENKPMRLLGVIQDITEQKEFSEALRKQVIERTAELEAKNKELEQFTYAASHDMQEPLRKVQTFSNMLMSSLISKVNDQEKMYLQKIGTSVGRMKSIIDDLLKYSHTRKEDQNFVSTDLNLILKNVQEDLELVISRKNALILRETLPSVTGVPSQIGQLFQNLINNALKFSKPDVPPVVQIYAKALTPFEIKERKGLNPEQNYVAIIVKDNGIGFAPEYSEQIFALFRRLHGKSEYEGTGIGLSLCKKIVENHNGDIFATSQLGEGAAFHVILPT